MFTDAPIHAQRKTVTYKGAPRLRTIFLAQKKGTFIISAFMKRMDTTMEGKNEPAQLYCAPESHWLSVP